MAGSTQRLPGVIGAHASAQRLRFDRTRQHVDDDIPRGRRAMQQAPNPGPIIDKEHRGVGSCSRRSAPGRDMRDRCVRPDGIFARCRGVDCDRAAVASDGDGVRIGGARRGQQGECRPLSRATRRRPRLGGVDAFLCFVQLVWHLRPPSSSALEDGRRRAGPALSGRDHSCAQVRTEWARHHPATPAAQASTPVAVPDRAARERLGGAPCPPNPAPR